jgi:ribonucleoside-diphosphate reductase alpha chain
MAMAKSGEWWKDNVQRALANNSICFTEKPDVGAFMREWNTIYESKSGERGIFNRVAAKKKVAENGRRDQAYDFGCNPCSEIILRDREFCNLSEVVIRSGDGIDELKRKVRIATILGTLQATLTNFRYLGKKWQDNTEEEALLGVSLTGIMDNETMSNKNYNLVMVLQSLKEVAIDTNKEWAEKLGINPSTAITCVKPSGTVSQLVDSASGIHPRYSPYYIRTVRADKKDPLARVMKDAGFPCEDDVTKADSTWVFSFPIEAPSGSVFRDDRTALEQLELWLTYQRYWCEHKPSITVYVKEHEWPEVGAWVWQHFDEVSGVSFLPHTEHTYRQAPYQEITKAEYDIMVSKMPEFDFNFTEEYDSTVSSQTLACTGGSCELVDLGEG